MSDDITFIQLSDTHFMADPVRRLIDVDPAASLQRVLEHIDGLAIQPDFMIISGDLTNDGEVGAYERLKQVIDPIEARGVPVLVGLGNHDDRVAFRRVWLGQTSSSDPLERYYYSRTIGTLRVIMLDSLLVGEVPGALDRAQLDWLIEQLRQPAPGGTLLVLHHPVVARGFRRENDYQLQNADELAAVLNGHSILGLLAGHLHMSSITTFAGTLTAVAPAVVFQFDPSARQSERISEGAGYTLGSIRDGRLILNAMALPGGGRLLREPW